MERREALGIVGALGLGLAAEQAGAADHPPAAEGGRFMGPVRNTHAHFCGIHIGKSDPKVQMLVQHYCAPLGEDMHQCLLFDNFTAAAKLIGVEYIITDALYRKLPEGEKKYWHPHTYEVLAGGLIAPGLRPEEEMKFMKAIINTWGKTWHTWPDPRTQVPLGDPMLMWAVTGDGQLRNEVVTQRDRTFEVNGQRIRENRTREFGLEVPNVSLPKSIDQVGRQWTDAGEDRPTRRKP